MPLVQIHLLEGRTPVQKRILVQKVTDAIEEALQAPRENIRVVLYEISPEHWAVGGRNMAERRAPRADTQRDESVSACESEESGDIL